jgi:phosphoglycerate dehydrogenase-like enzyme
MIKVLFIWEVQQELQAYWKERIDPSKVNLVFPELTDEKYLLSEAADTDAIVGWKPSAQILQKAKQLKLLVNPGAGVQHLAKHKELLKNITLVNGHGNAFFTAEHILAMLLSITNQLIPHHQWMLEGKWRLGDQEAISVSLKNRKVGLLGYGNVNQQVHEFLKPFGCEVLILKRNPENNQYGTDDLHDFLNQIDVLIATLPQTQKTENFIGEEELELLGKEGILINAGRGKTINEEALFNALKHKTIQAAGIDVWYSYDVKADEQGKKFPYHFPFYELDNVLLSPHRAASPFNDLQRWDDAIHNINCLANHKNDFINVVNIEEGY